MSTLDHDERMKLARQLAAEFQTTKSGPARRPPPPPFNAIQKQQQQQDQSRQQQQHHQHQQQQKVQQPTVNVPARLRGLPPANPRMNPYSLNPTGPTMQSQTPRVQKATIDWLLGEPAATNPSEKTPLTANISSPSSASSGGGDKIEMSILELFKSLSISEPPAGMSSPGQQSVVAQEIEDEGHFDIACAFPALFNHPALVPNTVLAPSTNANSHKPTSGIGGSKWAASSPQPVNGGVAPAAVAAPTAQKTGQENGRPIAKMVPAKTRGLAGSRWAD